MINKNLHSKELIAELEHLRDMKSDLDVGMNLTEADRKRLVDLEYLVYECEEIFGWHCGIELIHEDNFQDHIEGIIDGCCIPPNFNTWPYCHLVETAEDDESHKSNCRSLRFKLDIKAAMDEARQNYKEVEIDDVNYLVGQLTKRYLKPVHK